MGGELGECRLVSPLGGAGTCRYNLLEKLIDKVIGKGGKKKGEVFVLLDLGRFQMSAHSRCS